MNTKFVRVGVIGAGALIAFLAGLALGQRTMYRGLMPTLAADTQFNLTQRVETLANFARVILTGLSPRWSGLSTPRL